MSTSHESISQEINLDEDIANDIADEQDVDLPEQQAQSDVAVEIVDDTPEKDKGRKKLKEPPPDVTEEELESYGKNVKKRLSHLYKGFQDERRAKEQALRERQAAEEIARAAHAKLVEMQNQLKQTHTVARSATEGQLTNELETARRKFKEAYASGDEDALTAAQEAMIDAKTRLDRLKAMPEPRFEAPAPLQQRSNDVQIAQTAEEPAVDPKALQWVQENPWFDTDQDMTDFARRLHHRLVAQGVDPTSDDYYEKINSRMRAAYPDHDWDDEPTQEVTTPAPRRAEKRPASVVAPVTRSTTPRTVRLTKSQAEVAQRLGLTLEEYAASYAQTNGGL